MVQCIADRGNYFLLTTAPIALVAYFTVCLSRSSLVFKALVSLTMAQVVYALLAFNFEDTFHVDFGGQMALTLFALAGTTMLLMSVVAGVVLFFAATTLLTPVLYHNSALLGEFLDRHFDVKLGFWASTILFCVLLGVLLALLVLSRFFRVIGYGLRIVLASLAVFISARLAGIEYGEYTPPPPRQPWDPEPELAWLPPADTPAAPILGDRFLRLGLCCGQDAPANRCPIGFEDLAYNAALIVLVVISTYLTYKCRTAQCCCRKRTLGGKVYTKQEKELK